MKRRGPVTGAQTNPATPHLSDYLKWLRRYDTWDESVTLNALAAVMLPFTYCCFETNDHERPEIQIGGMEVF